MDLLFIALRASYIKKKQMKICKIKGCSNKYFAKGLCHKHYDEQYYLDNKKQKAERNEQYYKENKEYYKQRNEQYRKDNKQYYTEYRKQYYLDNKEYYTEHCRQYAQTPAGKAMVKAHNHNHRMLTKDLITETILRVYKDNIKKYGVLTCYLCGKPIVENDKRLKDSLDHSTPITRQGTNNYDNLGISHKKCNSKKHTMTLSEWFKSKSFQDC